MLNAVRGKNLLIRNNPRWSLTIFEVLVDPPAHDVLSGVELPDIGHPFDLLVRGSRDPNRLHLNRFGHVKVLPVVRNTESPWSS